MAKELSALELARLRANAAATAAAQTKGTANTLGSNLQGLMGAMASGGLIMDTSARSGFQNINFARGTAAAEKALTGVADLYKKDAKTQNYYLKRPWYRNILKNVGTSSMGGYTTAAPPTPTDVYPQRVL